ncbi:hypothetical protein LY76DRAFT_308473 [Colletotrichum caudatum]|nr:hypothetical protein LY76DRAFT_308473 [Colletotrichum caudatum]
MATENFTTKPSALWMSHRGSRRAGNAGRELGLWSRKPGECGLGCGGVRACRNRGVHTYTSTAVDVRVSAGAYADAAVHFRTRDGGSGRLTPERHLVREYSRSHEQMPINDGGTDVLEQSTFGLFSVCNEGRVRGHHHDVWQILPMCRDTPTLRWTSHGDTP